VPKESQVFLRKLCLSFATACAALAIVSEAAATTVNVAFDHVVKDNSSGIIGTAPWLTLSASDTSTVGTVQLTVSLCYRTPVHLRKR
jgi:hypothetical protein